MARGPWTKPWIALAIAAGALAMCAGPLLLVELWETAQKDCLVTPGVGHALDVGLVAGLATPVLCGVLVWRVAVARARAGAPRLRWCVGAGLVAAQVVLAVAALIGAVVADPQFLGTSYTGHMARSTTGRRAYLYSGGLAGCDAELWIAEPGAWTMRRASSRVVDCKAVRGASVMWVGDEPRVVGPDGAELPAGPAWNLDFGPH
jgi:hypothetical protein